MDKKVKVNTKDKFRVLLTDVLPYEVPLWLSNTNFYQRFSDHPELMTYWILTGLNVKDNDALYSPLNYLINRDDNSQRTISIMHPVVQIKFCDFYHKYHKLIKQYCTKSKQSLRYPCKIASAACDRPSQTGDDADNQHNLMPASYFSYQKYPFLHSFFGSAEHHKLGKQFSRMMHVDIANCFPSINTHILEQAVKNNKSTSAFNEEFDLLMQLSNSHNSQGILIGSEISRIFAEIILQKNDLNLIKKLEDRGYRQGQDYDFRRYVDDYFVFYNSDEIKNTVINALRSCLDDNKLRLNKAKTEILSRPFMTNVTLTTSAIKQVITKIYTARYKDDGQLVPIRDPEAKANTIITEIELAVTQHRVNYSAISGYLFSAISRNIMAFLKRASLHEFKKSWQLHWLLVDIDIIFYIYAMDMRIRTTGKLAELIHGILVSIEKWPDRYQHRLCQKIFDSLIQAIDIAINNEQTKACIETLNLFLILSLLPRKYKLGSTVLETYFDTLSCCHFYFSWVTFMLYIQDKKGYRKLRTKLIVTAENYLITAQSTFMDSAYFMLYFDYLACPYINKQSRKMTARKIQKQAFGSGEKIPSLTRQNIDIFTDDFMVSWHNPNYLVQSLASKNYVIPYS